MRECERVIECLRLEWEKLAKSTSHAHNYTWAYKQILQGTIRTIITYLMMLPQVLYISWSLHDRCYCYCPWGKLFSIASLIHHWRSDYFSHLFHCNLHSLLLILCLGSWNHSDCGAVIYRHISVSLFSYLSMWKLPFVMLNYFSTNKTELHFCLFLVKILAEPLALNVLINSLK